MPPVAIRQKVVAPLWSGSCLCCDLLGSRGERVPIVCWCAAGGHVHEELRVTPLEVRFLKDARVTSLVQFGWMGMLDTTGAEVQMQAHAHLIKQKHARGALLSIAFQAQRSLVAVWSCLCCESQGRTLAATACFPRSIRTRLAMARAARSAAIGGPKATTTRRRLSRLPWVFVRASPLGAALSRA